MDYVNISGGDDEKTGYDARTGNGKVIQRSGGDRMILSNDERQVGHDNTANKSPALSGRDSQRHGQVLWNRPPPSEADGTRGVSAEMDRRKRRKDNGCESELGSGECQSTQELKIRKPCQGVPERRAHNHFKI